MGHRISFYTDEQVSMAVVGGLRQRGINVTTAVEANLIKAGDQAHLDFCKRQGAVLFTQDQGFLRLVVPGQDHPGVVYAPQGTLVGTQVRGLVLIYWNLDFKDMVNRVEFI